MAPKDGAAFLSSAAAWAVSHVESNLAVVGAALTEIDAVLLSLVANRLGRPVVCGILLLLVAACRGAYIQYTQRDKPPHAGKWIPIFGNALWFRRDPAQYMCKLAEKHKDAGCFTLDLAGLKLHVLTDPAAMQLLTHAPETVFSEKQASLDLGYTETLGQLNAYAGAQVHRQIMKQHLARDLQERPGALMAQVYSVHVNIRCLRMCSS
jgi:Cytochrome P450